VIQDESYRGSVLQQPVNCARRERFIYAKLSAGAMVI
jgi:hypothetical protein